MKTITDKIPHPRDIKLLLDGRVSVFGSKGGSLCACRSISELSVCTRFTRRAGGALRVRVAGERCSLGVGCSALLWFAKTARSLFRSPSLSMPRLLRSLSDKSASMESTIPWSTSVEIKCSKPSALRIAVSLVVIFCALI